MIDAIREYLRAVSRVEVAVSDVRGRLRLTPMVASLYDFVRCRADSVEFVLLIERDDAIIKPTPAASLSHQGLSRTLQEYCRALSEDSVGLDSLSKQRLREMVGVAVAYEQRNASRFSVDGFEAFLAASPKREQGTSSHVVRILTIHRSKGLTLDRVFVPLAEGTAKWLAEPSGNPGIMTNRRKRRRKEAWRFTGNTRRSSGWTVRRLPICRRRSVLRL